ncbi:mucin-associated surface protein (MASP), putative [Trypanosoma cruzi marinkellei]|uniref:Mucin-associated surface protein (MASP), putative n=1 Tax=Trypanosoma cruzi marinkellei TaxID=85056 RepID=K2NBE2_TRYCR|nr:mucin-associated surface protein (MASP), putative [Trypanosoma cruzi marinkellei]
MAMMITGRVLLVCALCVLWCGAGGGFCEEEGAGSLSPAPGPVHGDKGIELRVTDSKKLAGTGGQVTVNGGVRDPVDSTRPSSHVPLVDVDDVTSGGVGGAGNGTVEEVAPKEYESLQNSCDVDGETSESCIRLPGSGGGHVDRGGQQDDRKPPLPLTDQTCSEEINSPLPAEGNPQHQLPVSRQAPVVVEQTDPVNSRPQEEATTLESEAVRKAADSHSQERAAELANGTLPTYARVTEAEDESKHIVDTHKDTAVRQEKPANVNETSKSTLESSDAQNTPTSPASMGNEAATEKEEDSGDSGSLTSISDNFSNTDTEQNKARDTSDDASNSTENSATQSAEIPRAPITTAKTDDTANPANSNTDKMGDAAPQTTGSAQANHTTTSGDSDGSTAISHTTSPLLLLLLVVACAAAAVVVAA